MDFKIVLHPGEAFGAAAKPLLWTVTFFHRWAVAGMWRVSQQMGDFRLSLSLKVKFFKKQLFALK